MKLSLYTLLTRDRSIEESITLAAQCGFDAIDIRMAADGVHLPEEATDDQVVALRCLAEAARVEISGLTTYYELGLTDQPKWERARSGLARAMRLCNVLGARFLRCSGPPGDVSVGYEAARAAFRGQAPEIAALAQRHGVIVTVEQHSGRFTASAGQIVDHFRGIETAHLGIVYDPGNCVWEGYERPTVQVNMLGDLIKAIHVKNSAPSAITSPPDDEFVPAPACRLDQGILDWARILAAIKVLGFDGYITLEDFFAFPTLEEKLRWDAQYLRGLLSS